MELMLEVISRHKFALGKASTYVFSKTGGYIGRDMECEWHLPDKSKQVSRKHILVTTDESNFYIEDLSTNGTYLTLGKERLSRGHRFKIEHGVSFYIGSYTIQAKLLFKPDAHLSSPVSMEANQLIPDDAFLDLDPLVAMDQQDEFEAKRRLGYIDDLLGENQVKTSIQSDHNDSPLDSMLTVNAISEDWMLEKQTSIKTPPTQAEVPLLRQVEKVSEVDTFFRILGIKSLPETPEERELIMTKAAEILLASVEGMLQSLRNRADSKNDLRLTVTTMTLASNNPLKFSPTAKSALGYLLAPQQEGMLSPAQCILSGFNDLHSHHMGLLAGARAAVRAALDRISPEQIEARLDSTGTGTFNKKAQLWKTFRASHQKIIDDPEFFAAAFLQDFARAYEVQVRTLHPIPNRTRRES